MASVSHLAENPDESRRILIVGLLSDRGARRGLRALERAHHSYPPRRRATQEPAGKLARTQGSPAQRPASRANQWRPFLPPCRCLAASFRPELVFIPGDLFDGTHADLDRLVAPFKHSLRRSVFFSPRATTRIQDAHALHRGHQRVGIRVLANESVTIDGMQIAGVIYRDSTHIIRMKAFLDGLSLDRNKPSILLNHAPTRLPIVEQAGVSLQLSGHTHGGQFIPFTWITRSVFGPFTSGLHRFGALQVYTSTGAGTWGPPMRVGSAAEIVFLTFECKLHILFFEPDFAKRR